MNILLDFDDKKKTSKMEHPITSILSNQDTL